MDLQNLAYAITQIVHNFGAVAVVAGPFHALITRPSAHEHAVLWLVFTGWMAQIASGVGFGMVSFLYYGLLPDIHGVAVAALVIKILCAVIAVGLTTIALRVFRRDQGQHETGPAWRTLAGLGIIALTAAAVLRWFS